MTISNKQRQSIRAISVAFLLGLALAPVANAAEHELGQTNKSFDKSEITIKVGDTVNFPNHDPFFHNVFSLSDVQFFDLGSYPEGESKSVVFETAGTIEVECAIHPTMKATILVQE